MPRNIANTAHVFLFSLSYAKSNRRIHWDDDLSEWTRGLNNCIWFFKAREKKISLKKLLCSDTDALLARLLEFPAFLLLFWLMWSLIHFVVSSEINLSDKPLPPSPTFFTCYFWSSPLLFTIYRTSYNNQTAKLYKNIKKYCKADLKSYIFNQILNRTEVVILMSCKTTQCCK